ncbi:extracellular solute-binding protein [Algicella marina]|uniref:Extracellular solute-binding protein n=1 Tax=Algicella marina TaxID=2683284 RepID=A0A6P1T0V1_9RHOB|nr:extracellular solute-binding protein [Algicella marina]QHQ34152.1 extracellular solute-binding protein [Algicella marina]
MKLRYALTGAASAMAIASAASADGHMANEMTIVSWGGAYSNSQQKAYHDPYMEKTGVSIVNDESSAEAVAKLRAMAEAGNVTWDVVDVVAADAMRLCDEGLALEIDADEQLAPAPDGTPASEDFGDLIVSDCFIPQIVYSTTFGYRTDNEGWDSEPDSVCAVFDTETFPGKRALEKRPIANMEWALICDGVSIEEVYDLLETDEGVDRAFAKLDTIKDQTVWWTAGAETPQLLADGEVAIGSTYNGRLFSVIEEQDQPVKMLWDWQMFDLDGWIIPAGLSDERQARALDYIYFATDTQRLADQAAYISYGPARASSAPLVGQHAELGIDMAPHMPTDPANAQNTFLFNYEWWADNRDDLDAKFQAWLIQ